MRILTIFVIVFQSYTVIINTKIIHIKTISVSVAIFKVPMGHTVVLSLSML